MISDDIKRLYYYNRQYLGFKDFQDEQKYHIDMRRRHNIAHHSWGIVTGLKLEQEESETFITPGMAVDGYGREIIVFSKTNLDINKIKEKLKIVSLPAKLNVWISYHIEKFNPPSSGYEVCDVKDQFMRVRETFELIYQDNPTFKSRDPNDRQKWPKASEKLSDKPVEAPWPVYLGTITLNKDPNDQSKKIITKVESIDTRDDKKQRRYVGVIGEELSSPNGVLALNPRGGKIGIGTKDPDTILHIDGGTDAKYDKGTGYIIIGSIDDKNLVMDKNEIMARNNGSSSPLHLQTDGGALYVHNNKEESSRFVIRGKGRVGIGTTTPRAKLDVNGVLYARIPCSSLIERPTAIKTSKKEIWFGDTEIALKGPSKIFVNANVTYKPTNKDTAWIGLCVRAVKEGNVIKSGDCTYVGGLTKAYMTGTFGTILNLPDDGKWTLQIGVHKKKDNPPVEVQVHTYTLSAHFVSRAE